jgi:hypothetical protein
MRRESSSKLESARGISYRCKPSQGPRVQDRNVQLVVHVAVMGSWGLERSFGRGQRLSPISMEGATRRE